MPESAVTSGPSLEQILWRAVDRFSEDPALVDAEDFAAHISGVFEGNVPAEAWVEQFFLGHPEDGLHQAPKDMAEAVSRASRDRLAVYEFDLNRLEYVIIEDKEKVVVVSDFGQFALTNDDVVGRAIEAAVIPTAKKDGSIDRKNAEPRAFFVRASGEVVAVDVNKVAKSLQALMVKQVSMPAVDKPASRMAPFGPVSKRTMSESREARALRQDVRLNKALPTPPRMMGLFAQKQQAASAQAAPAGAATTVFVLMPDGSLARPAIGSGTRWQEMVGEWATRASSMGGAAQPSVAATGAQKFVVQAGQVVAVFSGGERQQLTTAGEKALARGEMVTAVRADNAPIRILGDADLAKAIAQGATLVPGLAQKDRFWIQPEVAFRPTDEQRTELLSQGGSGASAGAVVGQPLQLGQITGDPWADWALTGGGEFTPDMMMAARGRTKAAFRAALDRPSDLAPTPALAQALRGVKGKEMLLAGAPVIGFRGADGSILVQRMNGPIRLATMDRDLASLPLPDAKTDPLRRAADLAPRSGALPATALAALQIALERTASAGGYRMPIVKLEAASDAVDVGNAMNLAPSDPRRLSASLAGPIGFYEGIRGPTAQLVLSMPFPNAGEVHVGGDLSDALQAYLGGFVSPTASPAGGASLMVGGALGAAAGAGIMVRMRSGATSGFSATGDQMPSLDLPGMHTQALSGARDALLTLNLDEVRPLVAKNPSLAGLPSLLARAIEQGGEWTAGPGAPMPMAVRQIALSAPFDAVSQQQFGDGGAMVLPVPAQRARPVNPGEDEIVIPMPLWSQMGRGRLSETEQIMGSPMAPKGYAPPMGVYQLVAPQGGPVDFTGGAPQGTPGVIEIKGPTGLNLVAPGVRGGQQVVAQSVGGNYILGRAAVDDGETLVSRRGRVKVGAPVDADAIKRAREAAAQNVSAPGSSVAGAARSASLASNAFSASAPSASTPSILSQGGAGTTSGAVVSGAAPQRLPRIDLPQQGTYVDGTFARSSTAAPGPRPMTGALSSALRMSDSVNSRALPGRPSVSGSSSTPSIGATGSNAAAFSARAQAAGQMSAAGSAPSGGSSVSDFGSGFSAGAGSAQIVVAGSGASSASSAMQPALDQSESQASIVSQSVRGQVDNSTQKLSDGGGAPAADSFVAGLSPGMWSGHSRRDAGYQSWNYGSDRYEGGTTSGGVSLSGLSRPVYPSLPTSLRFRYVGAPLWWSGSTKSIGGSTFAGGEDTGSSDEQPTRTMRSGLRAANSAASLWRSMFVSSGTFEQPKGDDTGGMDNGRDASADQMGALGSKLDALAAASLVSGGAVAGAAGGKGAESVYVAMNGSGKAGVVNSSAAQRAKANALELSIVAAIPAAPPALETMGGATGGDAPHARAKGHAHHEQGHHKEGGDNVSHSKIEGSVDAIAQRIYHRIRRRIQNDRERFGG